MTEEVSADFEVLMHVIEEKRLIVSRIKIEFLVCNFSKNKARNVNRNKNETKFVRVHSYKFLVIDSR